MCRSFVVQSLSRHTGSEGQTPLGKSVAVITSCRYKLIIHGRNKEFDEKLSMLILIISAICVWVVRHLLIQFNRVINFLRCMFVYFLFIKSLLMVGIIIVADCVVLSCQITRKLKRATSLEFTTVSAIIFIHC